MVIHRAAFILLCCIGLGACGKQSPPTETGSKVVYGAENLLLHHMALLKGKRVALIGNATSRVFERAYLADTLQALGVNLVKLFAPEHGFRNEIAANATLNNGKDVRTGLPIISLYGRHPGPTAASLTDVDLVLFDVQDVGTRFYTYLSTLCYAMDSCAAYGKELVILDRPNPNGWYVDGPVLEPAEASFVGLHPVPIVHGLTLGEYAKMALGQGWVASGRHLKLTVIQLSGYRHSMRWQATGRAWVAPSPNLPTPESAALYPILCWYEGTRVSVGRGTQLPFQVVGFPNKGSLPVGNLASLIPEIDTISFIPIPIPGKADDPPYAHQRCYGYRLPAGTTHSPFPSGLALLSQLYSLTRLAGNSESKFFNSYFRRLVGTPTLEAAILGGESPESIYASWQPELERYKRIRKKYLIYPN